MLVDANGLTHDRRIGAIVRAPVAIADHRYRISACGIAVFARKKQPAELRLYTEDGKEIARNKLAPHAIRMIFFPDAEG